MALPRKLERHVRQRCPAEAGRRQGSRAEQRGVEKKEAERGNRARRHAPTNGDVEIAYLVEAVKVTLITLGSSGSGLKGDHCSLVTWEMERPAEKNRFQPGSQLAAWIIWSLDLMSSVWVHFRCSIVRRVCPLVKHSASLTLFRMCRGGGGVALARFQTGILCLVLWSSHVCWPRVNEVWYQGETSHQPGRRKTVRSRRQRLCLVGPLKCGRTRWWWDLLVAGRVRFSAVLKAGFPPNPSDKNRRYC